MNTLQIIFCNQMQSEFIKNNIDKIIAKRLEHVTESGYVKISADGNYEMKSLKFKSKKSINEEKFQKVSILDSLDNAKLLGKLYFEVSWKKTLTKVKLNCDYDLDEELQEEPFLAEETLGGMVVEERQGVCLYTINEYEQRLKTLKGVESDHPFGKERGITLAALFQSMIVAIKLMAIDVDEEEGFNENDSEYSDELIAWSDEYEKLLNKIDSEFESDEDEF